MVLKNILRFCEKYNHITTRIAFFLISLQIVHLTWLTTDIVLVKLFEGQEPLFPKSLEPVQAIIDYMEIPGIFAGAVIYLTAMTRRRESVKNALFLSLLLIQIIHIFWITDEVVYEVLLNSDLIDLPETVAWIAIMIDYMELPVIFDLFKRTFWKSSG
jgi:hypothetical protein